MHATDYLKSPEKQKIGPMAVVYGSEHYLKQACLKQLSQRVLGDDEDASLTSFTGKETDLKTVRDELLTISMWGDARLVVVEDADDFVSKNRAGLEKYLEKPSQKSVLVLDVKSWTKTTRLAKAVKKLGLDLECNPLKGAELLRWLAETSREKYSRQLERDAAQLMVQLAGTDLGLLDQELSKLSSYVGDRNTIGPDDVQKLVGGWKAETTWAMLDALRDGDLALALKCLDKLLTAGEAPQRILGGMAFAFRKLAKATELSRKGTPLRAALKQAGVFHWEIARAENYLRRIGRPRAEKIYHLLLTADGDLKGNSRLPERMQLEQLLVRLSGKL